MTRALFSVLAAVAAASAALVVFAFPAAAQLRTFKVRLADGQVVVVSVDAAAGLPMGQIPGLPGVPIQELTPPSTPSLPSASSGGGGGSSGSGSSGGDHPSGGGSGGGSSGSSGGGSHGSGSKPSSSNGHAQGGSGSSQPNNHKSQPKPQSPPPNPITSGVPVKPPTLPGGVKPNFFSTLPGPVTSQSVPNFVINNFDMPIFLMPIYQAAGIQYGIRWEALAAINQIESNYGRDLSVSSAGALGWMQFMPDTWRTYGVDANGDSKADPYNPADAIFAAGRYLKAAGGDKNLRNGIFAYNHAGWYVDSVMLRAQLLTAYPADFVAALTGLTEARFPVIGKVSYGQSDVTKLAKQQSKPKNSATSLDVPSSTRTSVDIDARDGSPVIAANDGIVRRIGVSKTHGHYVVLDDVYGNEYTYSELGSVARAYPVPKEDVLPSKAELKALEAGIQQHDPRPTAAATAGTQAADSGANGTPPPSSQVKPSSRATLHVPAPAPPVYKARLFASPERPNANASGGAEQLAEQEFGPGTSGDFASFAGGYALNAHNAILRRLAPGATVVAGTILGRVGRTRASQPPHLRFEIQPAGKGAPKIDPMPVLDGWRLLESTNIYRPSGKNVLYRSGDSMSVGQVLLLSKSQLQQRVLSDPRIKVYACGRRDIATGQISRNVLATLAYLTESGLWPTVSSLKCGHSEFSTSGNVSGHASGDAVDITAINHTPVKGHQQSGGLVEQTVRRLMLLAGPMAPRQIVSLLSLGGNTISMPDHADKVSIAFQPLFGANSKLGHEAASILKPQQWQALSARLASLPNPVVPTGVSKYATPAH